MPDNQRQRIVPDVNPYTTPFNPNAGGGLDIQALLQQALAPQAPIPAPRQGIVQSILEAVGNGGAIAASNNPGAVLEQQMQARQQQKFAIQQQNQQRADRLAELTRQFGLSQVQAQLGEASDIRKEQRTQAYKKEDRKSQFDDYLAKNDIEVSNQNARDDKHLEAQKAAAVLQHTWDQEKEANINDRYQQTQTRLENKDVFDKKMSLIVAGIPANIANGIGEKLYTGDPLSPEENSALTTAAKRQMAAAAKAARGSGGSGGAVGITPKQSAQYIASRMKDDFVKVQNPDGSISIMERSNAPKDTFGELQGVVGVPSLGEKMQFLSEEANAIETLSTPGGRQSIKSINAGSQKNFPRNSSGQLAEGPDTPMVGGEQNLAMQHWIGEAQKSLGSGFSVQQTIQRLNQAKQAVPQETQYIDSVIASLNIKASARPIGKKKK